jgi:dTDP-4-dehydrorhamnose reductase
MKILVLGSSGQVGSELRAQLEVVLSGAGAAIEVTLAARAQVDMTDLPALRAFLEQNSPDWVINATAYTAVDKAETEVSLAYDVNEDAVYCFAEYCRAKKVRLVHISTDYVFDGDGVVPFGETHAVSPLGIYGASKLAGEDAIRNTLSRHIILRTAWVFGATGNNFVKTMLRLAESRTELGVVGDQFGSPTSARGIAKTIAILMSQMLEASDDDERWGTYHYSGYPFVSWAEFASEIFHQAHEKSMIELAPVVNAITTEEYPTPAKRPKNSRLDCSKIHGAFGVEPDDWRRSLNDMLDEIKGVSAS